MTTTPNLSPNTSRYIRALVEALLEGRPARIVIVTPSGHHAIRETAARTRIANAASRAHVTCSIRKVYDPDGSTVVEAQNVHPKEA